MAERMVRFSDLSDEMGAEPVAFSIAGTDYTIDLTEQETAEFVAAFTRWTDRAKRTGGRRAPAAKPRRPRVKTVSPEPETADE